MSHRKTGLYITLAAFLAGCTGPQIVSQEPVVMAPRLERDAAIASDGFRLPLRRWDAAERPRAIVLGLHGLNDYSRALDPLAESLRGRAVTTYAVDQRGFGATAQAGRWHGAERMAQDLRELVRLLRVRHPGTRVLVVGESMGGAVAMLAAAQGPLDIDGLVLIAPAVWSRDSMPWYQRLALSAAVRTVPWLKLTGEGLKISPTDNPAELRALSEDPLVIKGTRVDALWGVTELMDAARGQVLGQGQPVLLLYGEHDQIIPKNAFCRLLSELPAQPSGLRLAIYRQGWHLLPRDLQGERVRRDIAAWVLDPGAPLPSGEEKTLASQRRPGACGEAPP